MKISLQLQYSVHSLSNSYSSVHWWIQKIYNSFLTCEFCYIHSKFKLIKFRKINACEEQRCQYRDGVPFKHLYVHNVFLSYKQNFDVILENQFYTFGKNWLTVNCFTLFHSHSDASIPKVAEHTAFLGVYFLRKSDSHPFVKQYVHTAAWVNRISKTEKYL